MRLPRGISSALFFLLIVFVVFVPREAGARATSFDALTFRPANDSSYFFSLYGSRTLTTRNWNAGITLDYSRDPLILIQAGAAIGSIVSDLVAAHLYGGMGVTEWMDIGLEGAVAFIDRFIDPVTRVGDTSAQLGDLRFHMKFRLLDIARYPVGVSVSPYIDLPTGGGARFAGNNSFAGGGQFIIDTRRILNRLSFVTNFGFLARDQVILTGGTDVDDMATFGFGGNMMIIPTLDFIIELAGGTVVKDFFASSAQTPVETRGAFRYYFGLDRRFRFTVAAGGGLIPGVGSPRFRLVTGLAYTPPFAYREIELGETTLREAFEVYELVDRCPIEVEGYVVGRDDPRCTEVYELQSIAEACPEAGTFNPEVDNPRCLQVYVLREQDSDRDGVPDFRDQCPAEAGPEEAGGCPGFAKVVIRMDEGIIITQVIHFDFKEAILRDEGKGILDAMAATIRSQPAIQKISIEGHTDSMGPSLVNQIVSDARAKAVYDYLVEAGVNPQRLEHRGFGPRVPVADNRIEDGRARNRRVEFLIKGVTPGLSEALDAFLGTPRKARPAEVPPAEAPPTEEAPAEEVPPEEVMPGLPPEIEELEGAEPEVEDEEEGPPEEPTAEPEPEAEPPDVPQGETQVQPAPTTPEPPPPSP